MWTEYHKKPKTTLAENPLMDHIRYRPDIGFLSKDFLRRSFRLFNKAEKLAKDPEIARRVKLAKLPIIYTELSQGLGFMTDQGTLQPGTRRAGVDYINLVEEFAETVATEKITYFKEIWAAGDAEARVKFYRDRLTADQGN